MEGKVLRWSTERRGSNFDPSFSLVFISQTVPLRLSARDVSRLSRTLRLAERDEISVMQIYYRRIDSQNKIKIFNCIFYRSCS
ncbi:hypothetical protein ACOSQ3_002211 [Xanthoceras sorbifolium]